MQLRFASFAVINLRRDLHPQECAHAGRTKTTKPRVCGVSFFKLLLSDLFFLAGAGSFYRGVAGCRNIRFSDISSLFDDVLHIVEGGAGCRKR